MEKTLNKKNLITDILRGALISIIIGAILILLFAIIVNFIPVEDVVVTIVNQVIKVIAIFVGCLLGFKAKQSGLLKGLVSGLIYGLGTALIFALVNKSLDFSWGVLIDVALGGAIGAICGIIAVNIKGNK